MNNTWHVSTMSYLSTGKHVAFLARLVEKHSGGWPESSPDWSESEAARERDKSRERAIAMGAER